VTVNTKTQRSQMAAIEGSEGRIVLTHPFYCDSGDERILRLETDGEECEMTFGSDINHYQLMLEAFAFSIRNKAPAPLALQDSMANMAVIDAAVASVANNGWIPVAKHA
jgi:predicted dehydrogenase